MIFVDSNVPMYVVGAAHPHKTDAGILLQRLVANGERLVTSAEVLQEILHRYVALGRREVVAPAFEVLFDYVDEIFPIEESDVLRASRIVDLNSAF